MECVVTYLDIFFCWVCFAVCILNSAWWNEMRFLRIYIIRYLTNSKLVIAFLGRLANAIAGVCHCALLTVSWHSMSVYCYIECVLLLDCIIRQVIYSILFGTGRWWCRMSKRFLPPAEKRKTWVFNYFLLLKHLNCKYRFVLLGWCAWRAASSPVALHLFHSCRVRLWKESTGKLIKKMAVMECHYIWKNIFGFRRILLWFDRRMPWWRQSRLVVDEVSKYFEFSVN